jgi:hypothetical protein
MLGGACTGRIHAAARVPKPLSALSDSAEWTGQGRAVFLMALNILRHLMKDEVGKLIVRSPRMRATFSHESRSGSGHLCERRAEIFSP